MNHPPASRNTDPISSYQAEDRIIVLGVRATQADIVLDLVKRFPGKTSLEYAVISKKLDRYQTARRLSDLKYHDKVRQGETRKCSINKKLAVTWWLK